MSSALAIRESVPQGVERRAITFGNFEELVEFGKSVVKTPFCPKGFTTPESIALAVMYGQEIGLAPMASLRSVCIINGKPALYGDGLLAVVRASGLLEEITETLEGEGMSKRAICRVKRRGSPRARVETFTMAQAQKARLLNKEGPWQQYTDRMLGMRARGYALRDEFADLLNGLVDEYSAADEIEGAEGAAGEADDDSGTAREQARPRRQARARAVADRLPTVTGVAEPSDTMAAPAATTAVEPTQESQIEPRAESAEEVDALDAEIEEPTVDSPAPADDRPSGGELFEEEEEDDPEHGDAWEPEIDQATLAAIGEWMEATNTKLPAVLGNYRVKKLIYLTQAQADDLIKKLQRKGKKVGQ